MKQHQPAFNRYERLIQEQAADELYIAAPAGVIPADMIPKGWGFVEFAADFTPELVIPAVNFNISSEKRCIFSWRIAGMSARDILFANGVEIAETPEIRLIPKRRRLITTEKI